MKYIISGTNRPQSRSLTISKIIQQIYKNMGDAVDIIDLQKLSLGALDGSQYGSPSGHVAEAIQHVNSSEGLILVCPEYNGSYPGVLKYFIDHWSYPLSFEHRPVCFVGLGGRFGGLRPVEHLQGVFGYRNAFIYPDRVFLTQIFQSLQGEVFGDPVALTLLEEQAKGFSKFVTALQNAGLAASHN